MSDTPQGPTPSPAPDLPRRRPRAGRRHLPLGPLPPRHRRLGHRRLRRARLVRPVRGPEQADLGQRFVTDNAWMFPVICLPFSLLVGLLVKYAKAPSNLDGSILDSLTGDVSHLRWKDLPATVATSLASLFSGAVLGPEGAIGNIASKIAALVLRPLPDPGRQAAEARLRQRGVGLQRPAGEPRSSPPCSARRSRRPRSRASRPCRPASSAAASATPSSCCCTRPGS